MPYEYKVDIAGVEYGMKDIMSADIEHPLFDKLSVGNACSAQLTISLWPIGTIPRMAKIIPWVRDTNDEEWYQLGVFYIDTRAWSGDLLEITAYDAMLKAELIWTPPLDMVFPVKMGEAAENIASRMGAELDPRCSFNDSYYVPSQEMNYTMRDVLRFIGAAHAGNWIVTNEGKLLLVPLFASMPPETNYLVTENGDAIVFGGVRILV